MARLSQIPSLNTEPSGDALVIRFRESRVALTEQAVPALTQRLLALAEKVDGRQMVLDFGQVEYLSSLLLVNLIQIHRSLAAQGKRLILTNLPPPIYEVIRLTRLDTVLDVRSQAPQ